MWHIYSYMLIHLPYKPIKYLAYMPKLVGISQYPESQGSFRKNRLKIDMVFILRLLQEKCTEQNKPLYIVFINLTEAFDTVSRIGLYKVLEKIWCLPKLLQMICTLHNVMTAKVAFDRDISEPFNLGCGIKQGGVIPPTLFGIYLSTLLHHAFPSPDGIALHTRNNGNLFNLAHLRAKMKTNTLLIHELMFGHNMAFCAHSLPMLQEMCNVCSVFTQSVWLKIKHKQDSCTCYKLLTTLHPNQWPVSCDSWPVLLFRLYDSQDSNIWYWGIQPNQ